jgi:hypothetical protein
MTRRLLPAQTTVVATLWQVHTIQVTELRVALSQLTRYIVSPLPESTLHSSHCIHWAGRGRQQLNNHRITSLVRIIVDSANI